MDTDNSRSVALAKEILNGQTAGLQKLLDLADRLEKEEAFNYGWRILVEARGRVDKGSALYLKLAQQQAFCIYKDPGIAIDERFDRALKVIRESKQQSDIRQSENLILARVILRSQISELPEKLLKLAKYLINEKAFNLA